MIIQSDSTDSERRTCIQYLIEVVAAIDCQCIAMVSFAYINDSLSNNFNDYLNSIKTQNLKQNCNTTSLRIKPEQSDIRATIKGLYPEQELVSKFSVNNPLARFSVAPN
jgi:hypothetical protein